MNPQRTHAEIYKEPAPGLTARKTTYTTSYFVSMGYVAYRYVNVTGANPNPGQPVFSSLDRIAYLDHEGSAWIKEGALNSEWMMVSSDVTQVVLNGDLVAILKNDGTVKVKGGALNATWMSIANNVSSIEVSATRIGVIGTNGIAMVK